MRELSLNIMDVVQNSITAGASLIQILQREDLKAGTLWLVVEDDGSGMDAETVEKVQSPFYTTRTTRKVGLGVPFFKMACEMTGGSFAIRSAPGEGTRLEALFHTGHIDMTPVGNMLETILLLVTCNPDLDFVYEKAVGEKSYRLDTRELREVLEGVPLNTPDVVEWIRQFLAEQEAEVNGAGGGQ